MQLIVLSNRRDKYLPETLTSIEEHVTGVDRLLIVDDSGDLDWVATVSANHEIVVPSLHPVGYNRAMQAVFHFAEGEHFAFWEEDFRATAPIDLEQLAGILDDRPHLAQVALLRQPWYANEVAAGGVLQAKANEGHEIELVDGIFEHRAFFTGNPSVLPHRTYSRPWPSGAWSESRFGQTLLKDANVRFGMVPGVKVEHVGERSGFGY